MDRTVRLLLDRERNISQRETETPADRKLHLRTDRIIIQNNSSSTKDIIDGPIEYSAMKYDSIIDCRTDPTISIGSPYTVCQHCSALKWKDESTGIRCSNGMIKLDYIVALPDPLK